MRKNVYCQLVSSIFLHQDIQPVHDDRVMEVVDVDNIGIAANATQCSQNNSALV